MADLLRNIAGDDADGLRASQFLASQIDWRSFQANHRAEWMECLRAAFAGLDSDHDGRVRVEQLVTLLADKLPEEEVRVCVCVCGQREARASTQRMHARACAPTVYGVPCTVYRVPHSH